VPNKVRYILVMVQDPFVQYCSLGLVEHLYSYGRLRNVKQSHSM